MKTTVRTLRLAAIATVVAMVAACTRPVPEPVPSEPPEPPEVTERLILTPVRFDELPDWPADRGLADARRAFLNSCERMSPIPAERAWSAGDHRGTFADWHRACATIEAAGDDPQRGFETAFQPFAAESANDGRDGLFTGYYEPLLRGSLTRSGRYAYPLYRRPPDLVQVDLAAFGLDVDRRRFAGRLEGNRLVPYHDRAAIDGGALEGRGLELVWVDDSVDAFFLHIQGSGQVELPDGPHMRVGYAGQNGHVYRAIGRDLIEMGEIPRERMSMQAIRAWLETNPGRADTIMHHNPSYIFFRELDGPGPVGAHGAPLTPDRSLAVDPDFVPLGAPVWLDIVHPDPGERAIRRLTVAQDTGGAIIGPVRGDLFWGAGPEAERLAGHMRSEGRYYVLLPHRTPAGT